MDGETQAVWTQQIKSRLSAVLLYSIPTGTCVQEFMMVGKRADTLKPTLVITCGDAVTKRRVEKTFKSQSWLQELLKANDIMFVALVAKTTLSAGPASDDGGTVRLSESYAVQILPPGVTTSCGLGLLISGAGSRLRQRCTLGGIIVVNGQLLGLTAGHPFQEIRDDVIGQQGFEVAEVAEDSSDEGNSLTLHEPFIFNDSDDDEANECPTPSTVSVGEDFDGPSSSVNGSPHSQYETSRQFSQSVEWSVPQAAILLVSSTRHVSYVEDTPNDHDWALLEMLPPAVTSKPNRITHNDLHHDMPIEEICSGPACGEVTITIAGIGPRFGHLHCSPATMKIDQTVLEVQLIILECVLRRCYFSPCDVD